MRTHAYVCMKLLEYCFRFANDLLTKVHVKRVIRKSTQKCALHQEKRQSSGEYGYSALEFLHDASTNMYVFMA